MIPGVAFSWVFWWICCCIQDQQPKVSVVPAPLADAPYPQLSVLAWIFTVAYSVVIWFSLGPCHSFPFHYISQGDCFNPSIRSPLSALPAPHPPPLQAWLKSGHLKMTAEIQEFLEVISETWAAPVSSHDCSFLFFIHFLCPWCFFLFSLPVKASGHPLLNMVLWKESTGARLRTTVLQLLRVRVCDPMSIVRGRGVQTEPGKHRYFFSPHCFKD